MGDYKLKALITGVDKLSPLLKTLRSRVGGLRRDLRTAADGAMPLAAGIGVGIGVTAKAFADAEDAATGLEVSMMRAGGRVAPEFAKISEMAVRLGNRLPGTTADFQNMMTMLVRQGMPAGNILDGVGKSAAYLAVQLKKPPEEAAEFAAKMQDSTKTVSSDMMGLMDVIQRTFYLGVDDNNMLAAFTKISPVLDMIKQKGLAGAKAMAPLVVMMDQAGLAGESSGNAIRKVFQSGFDAKAVGKANAMSGLRLDFTNGKGEFGGMEIMFAQLNKLKGLNTQRRTGVLQALFGDDAESLQVVSVMIDKGISGYREVVANMDRQAGLEERVERQLGTFKNLWDSATGTFSNALAGVGRAFSPELKALATGFGSLSEKIQDFTKEHPGVVRGLVAMAVGLAGFKLAALGGMLALKLLGSVLTMTPLGIFLRVAVAGAAALIANWDSVKRFFSGFGDWIKEKFTSIGEFLKSAFLNFTPLGLIIKNWEPIVGWFRDMWRRVQPFIEPFLGRGGGASGAPAAARRPGGIVQAAGQQRLQGEMTVRFDNAPAGMRVAPGKTSQPGLRLTPDVGYNRFART